MFGGKSATWPRSGCRQVDFNPKFVGPQCVGGPSAAQAVGLTVELHDRPLDVCRVSALSVTAAEIAAAAGVGHVKGWCGFEEDVAGRLRWNGDATGGERPRCRRRGDLGADSRIPGVP